MEQHIPGIVLKDGLTQPVFDYKRCLFEKVYVETPVDTDGDGRLDLIAVYIRRPLETTQGDEGARDLCGQPLHAGV